MQISISNAIGGGGGTQGGGGTPSFSNVNSFSFDGIDAYFMGVGGYTELTSGTAMSVSVWFKSSTYTTLGRLLNIGKHVEIYQNTSLYSNTRGCFYYRLRGNFGNSFATLGGATNLGVGNLVDGQWHHLCFTWNGATTTAKVYEDGVLKVTNTSASGTLNNSTTDAYSIGAEANGNNPIDGLIDEAAIWTTELSASDVSAIYNNAEPTDLNNNGLTAPTTWQRMGDLATWNGSIWTMTDVNGGYISNSNAMVEANRTTDVPTASSFSNTKSIDISGIDDFVSFSLITHTDEFTLSFWIKPVSLGNDSFLVGREASGNVSDYVWLKTSSEIRVRVNFSNYTFSESGGNNINIGAWNHLLISRDSSNNVSIFLNGASFSTSKVAAGNSRLTQIGKVDTDYNGNVDETAFWDSDQSSNLATIYNSGVPNDISSLSPTLWYRMGDGDTAPTITDNGSSGNNGTMNNFTTFSTDVPT